MPEQKDRTHSQTEHIQKWTCRSSANSVSAAQKFLLQEDIFCNRKKYPVTGRDGPALQNADRTLEIQLTNIGK